MEQNFTYIFNICGAVSAGVPDKCKSIDGVGSAGALQINTRGTYESNDDFCYLVGTYSESSTKVALLDQTDPSKGLSVSYFGECRVVVCCCIAIRFALGDRNVRSITIHTHI